MPEEERLLPVQDARTDPEPELRELIALGRVKSSKIVRMQPPSSAKAPSGPDRLLPEGGRLPPLGLAPGRHHVYLGKDAISKSVQTRHKSQEDRSPWKRRQEYLLPPLLVQRICTRREGGYCRTICQGNGSLCLPGRDSDAVVLLSGSSASVARKGSHLRRRILPQDSSSRKLLSPNTYSRQSRLPIGGEPSLMQIAPGRATGRSRLRNQTMYQD